ncbi:Polygalacturonate 4-alpha-galacturonosyltransferase [Striga hermonthica]|uniref:Polygalacturonate 4-alpha-galacturonosyltransferase n=1 Tax=Striga hermonthica TaxID=68872 RepID=A0A9N7RTH3_STRHE|nr:Polygalacturonate 4-alpha-galacturonosyltransferase [Striga hermonthica]
MADVQRRRGPPPPPPGRFPPPPPAARPAPRVEPVDREKTCPLLLRVFTKVGGHHTDDDFSVRGKEPKDEVQIYTWMDATLRELTDLVKEVAPEARRRDAVLSFAFVYPDKRGRFVVREVGRTFSYPNPRRPDSGNKALGDLSFQVMAINRGLLSGAGINRSKSSGSRFHIAVLVFIFSFLGFSLLIFSRVFTPANSGEDELSVISTRQDFTWREKLALKHLKSLFSKEVIDVINASTDELGPLDVNFFRKNGLPASWKIVGYESVSNATDSESTGASSKTKQESSVVKEGNISNEDNFVFFETPAKLVRRQLREKRREKRAADLVKQDDEVIVKLENAAIEHSKSVDSAVLGKYSIWRKENENENSDSNVRLIRDQLIMARVYISLARMKNKLDLANELQNRFKESQRSLGEATADSDLHQTAPEKVKLMGQVLSKAKEQLYDCNLVTGKLRAMLQSADEQVRSLKKQSTFLSQLAAKTIPNGLHCLAMRLTIDYYLLPPEKRKFPQSENLENPNLYHYALFSDNVLAASVVVNSTIMNAKEPEKHVFHLVTDKLNFGAMNMWFLLNPPGKATIHVENVDEFKWLNSSYCPVLRQLESAAMKEYYFKAAHPTTLSAGSSNLKYRNPKYLSMLNHLRFYLPQVYPKLDKILFLDDDIVVQKDLTGLWSVDLHGKVNGAVETCGESFHRFDKYLNFSNPHIAKNFDPNACGWAYGMNMFDLKEWKKRDITGIYHKWQNMNEDRVLWKLGTLPPGLMTFYGLTHPLDKSWHVLGLGYNPSVDRSEIENAAVVHYNGNMKPWLELAMTKYKPYWTKYIKYDHPYIRNCKLSE